MPLISRRSRNVREKRRHFLQSRRLSEVLAASKGTDRKGIEYFGDHNLQISAICRGVCRTCSLGVDAISHSVSMRLYQGLSRGFGESRITGGLPGGL